MNKALRGQRLDTIFVLIIFCVFAMSVLMVLMLGASIYNEIVDTSREGDEPRTALSYIWTKVKNNDSVDVIRIGDFQGSSALFLDEVYGDTTYSTSIYHYNGWIYELFCEVGLEFDRESGTPVLKVSDLTFNEIDEGLIKVTSGSMNLMLSPRAFTGAMLSEGSTGATLSEGGAEG